MVWFQCEDCGENLKKPKLLNHFRICSATKLSCIDCGVMFGQDTVQGHVQCISEAEKYGPKGQGKHVSGATPKPAKNGKPQKEIDVNVGLSERPPWFCSLCNTSATSKQTLLGHADGKKHRAKARAFHAANQQTKPTEESIPASNVPTEETKMEGGVANRHPAGAEQQVPKADNGQSECENGEVQPKKRKVGAVVDDPTKKRNGSDNVGEVGAENIETKKAKVERNKRPLKEANHNIIENGKDVESAHTKEDTKHKIKWKKLIKSALKSDPRGVLKMKKLKKIVLKSLRESGVPKDEDELDNILEQKISSSSKFRVEGKLVHLEDKD